MAERYNFKYLPLVGKLPGKSMVEQTETAINELASVVYDNVGHVGNLAEEVQTANTNASNALDKATEALETSGRVYIKQLAAVDVNDYYDSELYYINNDGSTNIPVRDRGFLEVKTNDDKTACEQVFIADSTGTPYYRHGRITEQTLGEETTYVVTWSSWYRVATTEYVQGELTNYLPLSGGTLTGVVDGVTPPNGDNSKKLATTEFVNAKVGNYLPLSGGTINGDLSFTGGNRKINFSNGKSQVVGFGNGVFVYGDTADKPSSFVAFTNENGSGFQINAGDGTTSKRMIGKPDGTLTWDGQPIQTSSDKRLKTDFADVPADVLEAWGKVEWKQFKYIYDAERKGVNNCRWHTGLVAQDVKEVGEENHVDLLKYGILCHDVREAVEEEKDEDGNVVREASEAVDLWTVRYEEALAMEVIYLRNEIKKLREEIKALRTE